MTVIPVYEEVPFSRLQDLEYAMLCSEGIRFKDRFAGPQGSGQIPAHPHKLERQ